MQRYITKHWFKVWDFSLRKGGGVVPAMGGVKVSQDRELPQRINLRSWEHKDPGPTFRKPRWDQCRPSACDRCVQLHLFVRLLALRAGSGAQVALGNLFPMLDYFTQPLYRARSSVLPQLEVPCFVKAYGKPATF